ncbi:probable ribonuclease ZC3H12C isoform X1 [Apis mellifera]|uniref:Probable ribonuclease ZC3H12C isoform X1 n=1 Tax=Apis mellifera TaxID=7460 RepID=A0A7M7GWI0_APIME|nr:probable ribonuclease ZC3H12C isoform X1 [Apis mellifera]|eukprot:XP_006567666.1 probable ribonuclease ZC3H12C isoform X1 [Apis mellifera]
MICVHNSVCTDSRRSLDAKGYDRLRFVEGDMTVAGKKYVDCTVLETESIADAEDSSYDSDYEAEDPIGSTDIHSQELQVSTSNHSDVSRTASDTLAAEFAEYVTIQGSPPQSAQSPGYTARVEFALKLGYTERLVQTALEKLGPDPEQNELLAELIKLGASCSQKSVDTSEESDSVVDSDLATTENSGCSLRSVVIDGSNVAMSHGNKEIFSCRGIKICVDWFKSRGHKEITVFVPKWRKETSRIDNPIADQEILGELERDRLLVFTPSRLVGGKRMVCYDDRYILKLAAEIDGIVVSNDNYRDLAQENPEFRKVVEERILMYTFVNDRFMPPDDPLGRSGPTLDNFLRIFPKKSDPAPPCPYAKKCTYGNKCKFRHPERGPHPQKSVTEKLVEHVQKQLQVRDSNLNIFFYQFFNTLTNVFQHQPLCKTKSTVTASTQSLSPVIKSKSAENVTLDQPINSSMQGLQVSSTMSSQAYHSSGWSVGRLNKLEGESQNKHKKLQRQLTLNPVFDPRLHQLRQYQQASQTNSLSQQTKITSTVQHRALTRHSSNESAYRVGLNWEHSEGQCHQHVTRIASAPDSYQAWLSNNSNMSLPSGSNQRLGASDPQLNVVTSPLYSAMPSDVLREFLDTRTKIHYHLANIFPEEHVRTAMLIHPFETDPIEICVAILKMYPQ